MGNQFFPNSSLTPDIYWLSKPPAVRALREMISGNERDIKSLELAQAGYILDVPIDVWNWDPVTTMGLRTQYGFTWVPSALQAPLNGAVGTGPVPAGAIKVSTDAADYPSFDPPAPPVVPETNVVGRQLFANLHTYGPGAVKDGKFTVADGQIVTQDGVQYRAKINAFAIGTQMYFERIG